jgi:hypothetical protein
MQRVTDSHKPVIGHHREKHVIHDYKNQKKRHLCHANHIGNGSSVSLDVHNHLWDCGGYKTDVSQRQVKQEIVHGGVEM